MLERVRAKLAAMEREHLLRRRRAVGELARELPDRFEFRAIGGSMLPAISPGSTVTVVRELADRARVGDVVFVLGPAGPIVHRVIEVGGQVLLKGDALPHADGPLRTFEWIGRVVEVRPPSRLDRVRAIVRRLRRALRRDAR